uniref:Hexosyltransferase n=1 Tax=Neolamprologus brichardi TaxID=32507 RepID=A0A3Q4MRA1_NEOBR
MRLSSFLALFRPALPLILGLSLGCSLSLLMVSWTQGDTEDSCGDELGNGRRFLGGGEGHRDSRDGAGDADFQPRIVPYHKDPNKPHKKVLTRYIHTELGIRERLLVGVLTSRATLNTLAVAVNRTVAHHFHRTFFFTGLRSPKVPHGMTVVAHGDDRPVWLMYETVRHLHQHYGSEYDWFLLAQDDTYMQADRLSELVGHLSAGQDLYMGRAEEFIGGEEKARYCHGGYGYLLSRSLLARLQPHLDTCRNDILSVRPDEWLGRCIIDYLGMSCVEVHQEMTYRYFELGKNADPEREDSPEFKNAFTVHPVSDPNLMYRLHKRFSHIELEWTYLQIQQLQQMQISNLSDLTPEGKAGVTWPIGINPPFKPRTRFEVINWEYFTEEHIYSCVDGSPKCELRGVNRADVNAILEIAVERLNERYQPQLRFRKRRLLNGYRRFDPTRGMEYILDLALEAYTQKGHSQVIAKRVNLLRPLSSVEIIPMPYVTEATRVQVILPVTAQDQDFVGNFLDMYVMNTLDTHDNVLLTFLFIYDPFDAQRVSQTDVFAGVKAMIGEVEKRYGDVKIPWISVKTEVPSQVKLMDIISKKHPVDTLFFLASVWTEVNADFLNRCRMNSISNWQVFFPIHFQEYNPAVLYRDQQPSAASSSAASESLRDGHFDRHVFDEACFYNADYMTARTKMAADILDNEELLESMDVYDIFVRYSGLHVFRAVEPALIQKYVQRTCNPRFSEDIYHRCVLSNLEGLGSRSHLAMALFEQEQANST